MIKAEGTLEEWEKFAEKVSHVYQVNPGMKIKEAIIVAATNEGLITKPEWEQAYDDYHKASTIQPYALKVMDIMRDHIVELEKKLEKGK